jgi:hypothetical protein|tara:strand:+ start:3153 stop:3638 length:486 start_codon:yes stop_codon:yes gene_type:complete
MAYKGKYKVKNMKKYQGDPLNVIYRSMWERHCFKWCDENSNIVQWSSEEIVVPYYYEIDKKYHRYFIDLKVKFKDGKVFLIEIKPDKETKPPKYPGRQTKRYITEGMTYVKNMNKWEAAHNFAKDRGWEFHIWTEHTLEKMGIKPKALKPLAPYKKKKKKK